MYLPSMVPINSPWSESVIISSLPTKYNTRHKSLKQEPFVLNFLQISYIHSSHLCSHSNVPLSFPNVEPRIFWSTETTVIPKSTLGKEKITQVFQDLWRVLQVDLQFALFPSPDYWWIRTRRQRKLRINLASNILTWILILTCNISTSFCGHGSLPLS